MSRGRLTSDIEASKDNADTCDNSISNGGAPQPVVSSANEHSILAEVMDNDSRLGQLNWDDMQLDTDWSNHDPSQVDKILTSIDTFFNDASAPDEHNPASLEQLNFPPNTNPLTYDHSLHGSGNFQSHDGGSRGDIGRGMDGNTGGGTINLGLEKPIQGPSIAVTQLSQLSMSLALLRYTSYNMAKAAESSSCHPPSDRRIPLIDSSAFEFVSTWLAHSQGLGSMNGHPLAHESQNHVPYPTPPDLESGTGVGRTLREVFCASQRLLEILGQLQFSVMIDPFPSPTATPPPRPHTEVPAQETGFFGLPLAQSFPSQVNSGSNHGNCTLQITHHLVMACEALLLEIYVAVLVALQHDAYSSTHTTALGDVRLVLVVQLCSYLIERQLQAVDLYLKPHSGNGPGAPNFDNSGAPGNNFNKERHALNDLRNQVQQRLACLRQTLCCR